MLRFGDDSIPANNIVRLASDGVLLIVESGFQTEESIARVNQMVVDELKQLHKSRQKLILVDISRVTGHTDNAGGLTRDTLSLPFDVMALYGANRRMTCYVNIISFLRGTWSRVRAFRSLKKASRWMAGRVTR